MSKPLAAPPHGAVQPQRLVRVDVLLMNTDRTTLAQRHPDDARKVITVLQAARPDWDYRAWAARDGELPPDPLAADAWVLTGSVASVTRPEPWMERTADALRQRHAAGRALVGLCFGHQLIAQALGGAVGRNVGGFRLGVAQTTLVAQEPWMDPPLARLSLFAAHEDQVQQPPPGARVLGSSAHCPVGAYAIGQHVLCTQYHPELTREFMRDLLASFGHKFDAQVVAQANSEIEQPVDASLFMQWVARFIEAAGSPSTCAANAGTAPTSI
ncbi:MAG: type 1 glutamine amidotransferase [Rubrivivax sp.]